MNRSQAAFATGQILESDIFVLQVIELVRNANMDSAQCQAPSRITMLSLDLEFFRGRLFPWAASPRLSAMRLAHFIADSRQTPG